MSNGERKSAYTVSSGFTVNPALSGATPNPSKVLHNVKAGFEFKQFDLLGDMIHFKWNGDEVFKTKVGIFWTLMAYGMVFLVAYIYGYHFIVCDEPNVTGTSDYEVPTKSAPILLGGDVLPTFSMDYITPFKVTPLN
jgi:hypothetical protein